METKYPSKSTRTFQNLDGAKQRRILKAALEEFSDHGFQSASINRIVSRLGIAKGSLYQYFRSKQGLFLFVFDYALNLVKDYLRGVRSDTVHLDVFERIRETFLSGAGFVRKHPKLYNVYLRMVLEGGIPLRRQLIESIRSESVDFLESLLEEGRKRGEVAAHVDLRKTAFLLDAMLDRFLQAYSMAHQDAGLSIYRASDETLSQWADELIALLRRGISP